MSPNLEMQVNETQAGLYTVTYGRIKAPLDVQEAAFAANGLEIVSPAQVGFLRHKEGKGTFNPYSRTNADVFYDDRTDRVVIVPNRELSNKLGIANLVDAHRQGREYVIPENQRDGVYAMVDEMLRKGTAFTASYGQTNIPVSEFGQIELTSKLFSDEGLAIKAQDYGDWLNGQGIGIQSMSFDDEGYAKSQKGPYANRLSVYGRDYFFIALGICRLLDLNLYGAFGVRFEKTAAKAARKSRNN